ncbi:MAG: hypothetical protein IJ797_08625 [Selenomonadaceae bacterium]|nr:hypothetical protein [Selenomonadaceae bacterium]
MYFTSNEDYENKKELTLNRLSMIANICGIDPERMSMGVVAIPPIQIYQVAQAAMLLLQQSIWNGKTDNK